MQAPYYIARHYSNQGLDRKKVHGIDDINEPLSAWLLRPYLDLGPLKYGPIHAQGLELAYDQFVNDDSPPVVSQFHPSPMLRHSLISETGLLDYHVTTPKDLPESLRTERWQRLVEKIQRFPQLPVSQKIRVVTLLDRLCLHHAIVQLMPLTSDFEKDSDILHAVLAMKYAHAAYKLVPSEKHELDNLEALQRVALATDGPAHTRLSAALSLTVHYAKSRHRNPVKVRYWSEIATQSYQLLRPEDNWQESLYASTYWRAISFVPFLAGDKTTTVAQIGQAEKYAYLYPCDTDIKRIVSAENIHPLLETQTKVALWLGDLELALELARKLAAFDPFDPKVIIELGDVLLHCNQFEEALQKYLDATKLGVPYTSFAWFMVGHCLELLEDLQGASDAYIASLKADPGGMTTAQRLLSIAKRTDQVALANWCSTLLKDNAQPK